MALKKPTPVEHPPPADPSSDEEEEVSNEEAEEEEEDESDESEEDEATQPTPLPQPKSSTKVPKIHIKKSDPKPASPDDRSDSGSDTGSDSEATPVPDLSKSVTLPISPPPPSPAPVAKSAKKRPADSKDYAKNLKKLKDVDVVKKTDEDEVKKVGEDSKKQLFQRLFSEDDEIELLKGMLKYSAEKGVDPAEDLNGFHKYVKSAIHVDVTRAQLSDKIRRLKKKYQKNVHRNFKSKKGVERSFSKPFGQISYDLSKKIWGDSNAKADVKPAVAAKTVSVNGGFEVKANGKGKRTPKPNMTPDQKEKHASSLQIPLHVKNDKEHVCIDETSSLSLCLAEVIKSKDTVGMGLSEEFFKKGLELLGDEVKVELEEKWKSLVVAEAELYYKRLELTREQVKLTIDAFKSSGR